MGDNVVHVAFHKDKAVPRFIEQVRKQAQEQGMDIMFNAHEQDQGDCTFIDEDGQTIIAVNTDGSFEQWFSNFIHLSSHLDQMIQAPYAYQRYYTNNVSAMDLLDLWIDKRIELDMPQLKGYISLQQDLEHDCETRSVDKIRTLNLPVNEVHYIQKANAHIWSFSMLTKIRRWPTNWPENIIDVWSIMPMNLDVEYFTLPLFVENTIRKYCYSAEIYQY